MDRLNPDQQFYGPAFLCVVENEHGHMFVHNEEYITRVNFHPLTGQPAKTPIEPS